MSFSSFKLCNLIYLPLLPLAVLIMSLPTRRLGKDGPEVTGLGLGLMSLGSAHGPAGSDEERLFFLDKACELGARNWDSADIYGDTEALLGK
jgi:aryl-alcohol dehydrogenase-like predicted oxidoreductase